MAKFKKERKGQEQINTSALPDIIFMLLFFFMVTTVLREQDILVEQKNSAIYSVAKASEQNVDFLCVYW